MKVLVLIAFFVMAPIAPAAELSGVVRVAGNPELAEIVGHWAEAFEKLHPGIRIVIRLTGSDTGMAALYTGKADLALLGRAPTPSEIQAFEWIFHYRPAQVEILTGSLDHPGRSPAPVLFVHRDNPLYQLSLAQLDASFGTDHRFVKADIRTWGQLGLTGKWADKPVHLYGPDAMSGTGRFFRHVVLNDSRMMNWDQLTEFNDTGIPLQATHDASRQILAALARDRYGLAVASLGFANPSVRAVPVEGVPATRGSLISRQYPLTRAVVACCNRPPGKAADPVTGAFIRYILSPEGQQRIGPADGYLPLTNALAAQLLRKLDQP